MFFKWFINHIQVISVWLNIGLYYLDKHAIIMKCSYGIEVQIMVILKRKKLLLQNQAVKGDVNLQLFARELASQAIFFTLSVRWYDERISTKGVLHVKLIAIAIAKVGYQCTCLQFILMKNFRSMGSLHLIKLLGSFH